METKTGQAILVRIPRSLHAAIKDLSHEKRMSMNSLVCHVLTKAAMSNPKSAAVLQSIKD